MRTGDSFSPGTERPWCEFDLSPPYNAEVKNGWCYTCTHSKHLTGTLLHTSARVYDVRRWIIFGIMTSNLVCCIAVLTALSAVIFVAIFVPHLTYICFNRWVPCILYIGQAYRYSPEYTFYIFSQQIYLMIFLDYLAPYIEL